MYWTRGSQSDSQRLQEFLRITKELQSQGLLQTLEEILETSRTYQLSLEHPSYCYGLHLSPRDFYCLLWTPRDSLRALGDYKGRLGNPIGMSDIFENSLGVLGTPQESQRLQETTKDSCRLLRTSRDSQNILATPRISQLLLWTPFESQGLLQTPRDFY